MWIKNTEKLDNGDPDMIWVEGGTADEHNMHYTMPSAPLITINPQWSTVTIPQAEYNRLLEIERMFQTLKRMIEDDDSITLSITPKPYEGNTW